MPEPAGLSVAVPMNGQFVLGAVRLFVASTEKLNPVALVKEKVRLPLAVNMTPPKVGFIGAGMLKAELVTLFNPLEVKVMVAPLTAVVPNAVKSVNLAVPDAAALVVVPPKVQVPWTGAATMLAELATALPNCGPIWRL